LRPALDMEREGSAMHLHGRPLLETRVPVVATLRRSPLPHQRYWRPDLSFVAHLIAMHTRALQRTTPSEAQVAYRSIADQNHTTLTGVRIRQTA
jgi:hypothetical protein